MSTRCGGSGRGGGYHSTTYSAWASVIWDYTGALVSDTRLSGAPAVNPALSAYDQDGNEIYNQNSNAYLLLAPGFVPAPRVTSLSVTAGPASGAATITITGTGMAGATSINFGTTPATQFAITSATSITAVSPVAPAGTVDVTVTSAGGTSTASAADQYTFVAAPSVSNVSPGAGSMYGGTEVTITGTNLTGVSSVYFGGTPVGFAVNGDTSITATAPASEEADTVAVTVTSTGGTSLTTPADRFTYTAPPAPAVTGVTPSSGPEDGWTAVTITGSGFINATEVDFGGVATYFWANDDSSITAYSPTSTPGMVDVTVISAGGTSSTSDADQYTYTP